MAKANIKISSQEVAELKKHTGEKTSQKAVQKAILYFLQEARQRKIIDVLNSIKFNKKYSINKLRKNAR